MPSARAVTTSAVLVAIGGCAALVVGMAAASAPKNRAAASLPPLPATVSATSDAPARTYAIRSVAPTAEPSFDTAAPAPASSVAAAQPTAPRRASSAARPAPVRPPTTAADRPAPPPAARATPVPVVRGGALPLGYSTGSATKVITVVASSTASMVAVLQAWVRAPGGGWLRYGTAVGAHVGSQGLTATPSESRSATPIGSFTLTQTFGSQPNPGTSLPYLQTTPSDWWVSDPYSSLYNQHVRCGSSCPFTTSYGENLYTAGYVYSHAVVIDYHSTRFAGGSAFFLHVTDGGPTAGCVSIPAASLVPLMRWLTPGAYPRILIGIA
jgi:L,D-peptidoglycan transpeptidase YkuD (ErfK/YbiS/YcfS/YnhG family)